MVVDFEISVNSELAAQFNIETNHAHTFWGLCARLYTKLTAPYPTHLYQPTHGLVKSLGPKLNLH